MVKKDTAAQYVRMMNGKATKADIEEWKKHDREMRAREANEAAGWS